ncbi:MAG: hypothetical protein ACMG51_07400 [Ginsengibacter sp.]
MPGTGISAAVLENIESGRRSNLDVSQLLNIAHTLKVPVTALLAPIHRPGDLIDLPNLTEELAAMTAGEFDVWVAGITTADHIARTSAERDDLTQINALRELQTTRRELDRLHVVAKHSEDLPDRLRQLDADQIDAAQTRINKLRDYLNSSGWEV